MNTVRNASVLLWMVIFAVLWGCSFDGSIVKVDGKDTSPAVTETEPATDRKIDTAPPPADTAVHTETDTGIPAVETTHNDSASLADTETATSQLSAGDERAGTDSHTAVETEVKDPPGDSPGDSPGDPPGDSPELDDTFSQTEVLPDLLATVDPLFTFFTIADIQDGPTTGENHLRSMAVVDPSAIALFEVGDLTHNALKAEWIAHQRALQNGAQSAGFPVNFFRTDVTDWGNYLRFVGIVGNHDVYSSDWLYLWNRFLPGQQQLGANSERGVYFSLKYANTLFLILDSSHPSEAQTAWLQNVLSSSAARKARWKIAMFHEPVYPCNSKPPSVASLPWVSLFEEYGVDLAVHGHAHTFERTCPMNGGICAPQGSHGVIYLTASGGGTVYLRSVYPDGAGTVSYGERSDTYQCSEILQDYQSAWNHFCHYTVGECQLLVRCFDHNYWNGGTLRHQFGIDNCAKGTQSRTIGAN